MNTFNVSVSWCHNLSWRHNDVINLSIHFFACSSSNCAHCCPNSTSLVALDLAITNSVTELDISPHATRITPYIQVARFRILREYYLRILLTQKPHLGGAMPAERERAISSPSSTDLRERRTLPAPVKTCPRCEDIVRNGSIHCTLAYSRCRCHRSWKCSTPMDTLSFDTRCSSAAIRKIRPFNIKGSYNYISTTPAKPIHTWSKGALLKRYTLPGRPHLPPLICNKSQSMKCPIAANKIEKMVTESTPISNNTSFNEQPAIDRNVTNAKQVSFFIVETPSHQVTSSSSSAKRNGTQPSSIPSLPQIQRYITCMYIILTNLSLSLSLAAMDYYRILHPLLQRWKYHNYLQQQSVQEALR